MKDIEQQIKELELDVPSVGLDQKIEKLLSEGENGGRSNGVNRNSNFILYLSLGNAAAILLIGVLFYFFMPRGDTSHITIISNMPGVSLDGSHFVIREQFLVNKRAMLMCWSSRPGDADQHLKMSDQYSYEVKDFQVVSHTGERDYKLVPLRTDRGEGGLYWHWALCIANDEEADIRTDPPFIHDPNTKMAVMLTPVNITEVANSRALVLAQRKTASAMNEDAHIYDLKELQALANRN